MADTLVGTGYDQYIGTRQSSSDPTVTEFYNKQSGMGFESPQMLSNFVQSTYQNNNVNAGNVFDVLKTGLQPSGAALNPTANGAEAATALDGSKSSQLASSLKGLPTLDQLLLDAQNYRNQILGLSTPGADELAARQGVNDATNTLKNFDISLEGGIQKIMNKPIALEFQQGQQSAMTRDAAFTRSSLTRGVDVANQTLQTLQNARLELLNKLNTAYGFGQNDIATKLKLDEITRAEQAQAKELALQFGVNAPFYSIGGTVYRTSDGKAYSSPEQFFADGGSRDWSNVQQIDPNRVKTQETEQAYVLSLMEKYPDAGILPTDSYGAAAAKVSSSRIYQEQVRPPSTGGGGGGTTEKDVLKANVSKISGFFDSVIGRDGYVSPEDWKEARRAWVSDGYTANLFNDYFSGYVNPADPQDYGVKL